MQVATLTKPNVYSDSGGLYLRVRASGRSWFYIGTQDGKRIELRLGSALDVPPTGTGVAVRAPVQR